ncbi:hypothetical protein HANVADRAFT_4877 [Hanseniaspora valbyensis NRRL Y-1626]|uniref:DH domain-containing protein n=1 Tax=Hanseniaspora valbyensis NRRL Y-1626 TaxID=766949 RepID=A0A1B7TK46_9ASCO|nr:hypothetical protein HANVADRAFT_4877 [Hanseniaspora valbyensis NRRL Y-1626]
MIGTHIQRHKKNKSSIGSTTSFVVNSVVKQFNNEDSDTDDDYESISENKEKSITLNNDYSSLYQTEQNGFNTTDQDQNNNINNINQVQTNVSQETKSKQNDEREEEKQLETKPSLNIENVSLPTNIFNILQPDSKNLKKSDAFLDIFSKSCIIKSEDDFLLKKFIAIVYNIDKKANTFSCFIIDKFGSTFHNNLDISKKSKYYEAIHNLPKKHFDLNVSKCVAAAVLQKYAYILKKYPSFIENKDRLNPVTAAKTLDKSELIDTDNVITPLQVCLKIQQFSLLNDRQIFNSFIDVVYDSNSLSDKMEYNNYLVSFLGDQLEQLFDPLTEYSPEEMEQVYKLDSNPIKINEADIVESIIKEFISVQTYLTIDLVKFLTKFIIPLRIAITNQEIPHLSTAKFNSFFPPTIDEVTRINCIFLDALKIASEYSVKELIKAVYQIIPYFYKAYTRHEAATKNFNVRLNKFSEEYDISKVVDTNVYTILKIDTIINGPQEKLFKIKLILERLMKEKEKDVTNPLDIDTKKQYEHILHIIDQFGISNKFNDSEDNNYQQRVFTPSGKILTELASNWPLELQYKWLKRKVVGIFDCINEYTGLKNCIVIFSDYIVCLELLDDYDILNNPLISDILMNSLINEKPLPIHFPKLRVSNYCQVSKTLITAYGGKGQLRLDLLNEEQPLYLQLVNPSDSTEYICELVTKACILCKSSAFHLFKQVYTLENSNEANNFNCYVTAHDMTNFQKEKVKSPFAIFLNIDINQNILINNDVYYGFFVNSLEESSVEITILSQEESFKKEVITCRVKDFNQIIMDKVTSQFFVDYYYSLSSPLIKKIISINESIVDQIQEPLIKLKQSVLLNRKELQRFSTITNPNSPLVNFSPRKLVSDKNSTLEKDNNKLVFTSNNEPEALEGESARKSSFASADAHINSVKYKYEVLDSIKAEIPVSSNTPAKKKSVTIDAKNNVEISESANNKDKKKSGFAKQNLDNHVKTSNITLAQMKQNPKTPSQTNSQKDIAKKRKKNRLSAFFASIFGPAKYSSNNNQSNGYFDTNEEDEEEAEEGGDDNDEYNDDAISENNVEIGEAYATPVSTTSNRKVKMIYSPDVSIDNDIEDVDSLIYGENGNNKILKISQSPSFRELFLKLESDLQPLPNNKKPNYWTGASLHEGGLKNEKDNENKSTGISKLYDSVILEEEEEEEKEENAEEKEQKEEDMVKNQNENQFNEIESRHEQDFFTPKSLQTPQFADDEEEKENIPVNIAKGPSLHLNTKIEKLSTIPKHSPLETQFPTTASTLSTPFNNQMRKPEKYGNKFKVVRHQESVISPAKSDFLLSPTKTPEVKTYNDEITDDIKTMTLDGVHLDFVSPVKNNSGIMNVNGTRIVSDLNIDFSEFNSTSINGESSNNIGIDQELQPNSPLLAILNKNRGENGSNKESQITTDASKKNKKLDIRSESFGYLSEFI